MTPQMRDDLKRMSVTALQILQTSMKGSQRLKFCICLLAISSITLHCDTGPCCINNFWFHHICLCHKIQIGPYLDLDWFAVVVEIPVCLSGFSLWTSAHGFHHIPLTQTQGWKIFWGVLVFICSAALVACIAYHFYYVFAFAVYSRITNEAPQAIPWPTTIVCERTVRSIT